MLLSCPECGWPQEEGLGVEARCDLCGWKGQATDRLILTGELVQFPQMLERLRSLFQFIANELSVSLGKKLIHFGLITPEQASVPLLASVTRAAARAAFQAVVRELFLQEESDAS
jgi:hypothetical protein